MTVRNECFSEGRLRVWCTTRHGGVSEAPFDSLNLGDHVGDDPNKVASNRSLVQHQCDLPGEVNWLVQTHGTAIVTDDIRARAGAVNRALAGDAAVTSKSQVVLGILTADCFPVVLYSEADHSVAALHVGWRGLAGGIIEKSVAHLSAVTTVWVGPGIRSCHFEVGAELKSYFDDGSFIERSKTSSLMLDLPAEIRRRIERVADATIIDHGACTYCEESRFFSYRRDGQCGRFATLAWVEP